MGIAGMSNLITFDSRDALYAAAADAMALALKEGLLARGTGHVALSGGSTPAPIYERLSTDGSVDWTKVTVTLADERMTEPGDPASNEVLVRNTLLQNEAKDATFAPLGEGQAKLADQDVILLGMGGDGHFASLFPTAKELNQGMDAHAGSVLRMTPDPLPANAPFPRLTLSLAAILRAKQLILAITGEEKRSVLEQANTPGDVRELPIRALLAADHPDFTIVWAS